MKPERETSDWLMLGALTLMWGSSFLFTKLAVEGLAFAQVVTARLVLGASVLVPIAVAMRRPVPRQPRAWLFFLLIAVIGNLLPFSLITWGQRSIDSGLAGILMAVMPLATLGLAHLFVPGERLTRGRVGGFLLGFAGVVMLLGPEALLAIGGDRGSLLPMLAVLAGALCYGVSAILSRLRPTTDALTTAAAVTAFAALLSLPGAIASGPARLDAAAFTPSVIVAVLFLGLFSTATAMLVYFRLIQTAGPGFTSQLNYLIPLWAVAIGILFLGEALGLGHLIGLLLILGGVLIARRRAPAAPRARAAQGSAQRADQPAGSEQGSRSV
ncbi:DMT family transporter [Halochromatium glycolicum]|uniref:EamA family transporter n=1 Tax=Halochromatium glycolicum TaxID=85075 RepID=A0AAJ0XA05_9GAMM|nr:DMT family transporter [Halochromatium glycolicum]MBK1705319.1 EamA family transporter [Halochromatium glycolicum]